MSCSSRRPPHQILGWPALVGVAVLALSLVVSTFTAKKQSAVQEVNMAQSDARVPAMAELLSSIKLIKLYSWQLPFLRVFSHIRHGQEQSLCGSSSSAPSTTASA